MSSNNINKKLSSIINTSKLPANIKSKLESLSKEIEQLVKREKAYSTLVNIDDLTGLYNHKCFHETLSHEISRAARFNYHLSLVMIDIDHFKRFNDTYGHLQGDIVLKEMGTMIKKEIRSYDAAFRYGGEEIALVMPHTRRQDAYFFIERMRKKISKYHFYGVRKKKKEKNRVTISAGIAAFPENAKIKSTLISRADKALYMAKEEGRNRVCSSSISGKDYIRFAFCPPTLSPFFSNVLRGIRDVAGEVGNVEVLVLAGRTESSYKEQKNLIGKAIDEKVDAIGLCSKIDLGEIVARANKSEIKVFVFNVRRLIMTSKGKITSFVGYEQIEAGMKVGEFLVKMLRHKGKIAILEGIPDEIDSIERKKGFIDIIKNSPSIKIVASEPAFWQRSKAKKSAVKLLKKYPDIDAFFSLSDEMALGTVDAVNEAGRSGQVLTIGLDGNQNALRSIKKGELFATLNTNPFEMGRILMRTVIRSTIKEEVINQKTESPIMIVDMENVDRHLQ